MEERLWWLVLLQKFTLLLNWYKNLLSLGEHGPEMPAVAPGLWTISYKISKFDIYVMQYLVWIIVKYIGGHKSVNR